MAENERGHYQRVSPIKPSLRGAGNWTRAQFRAASYSRKAMMKLSFTIVFMLCALIYLGLWMGGVLPTVKSNINQFTQNRLMTMGFVVKDIDVVGEGRIRERDVRTALGIYEGQYFFAPDLDEAQDRVKGLNWVENVVVRRLWPNRIVVEIIERDVFAIWQNDGQFQLIDQKGVVIENVAVRDYAGLPHLIGEDVSEGGSKILTALSAYPDLAQRFTALRHVGNRRWDMIDMHSNLTVKLPEGDIGPSLKRLMSYHAQTQWLDRKIEIIDMRVAGRISVRPQSSQLISTRSAFSTQS